MELGSLLGGAIGSAIVRLELDSSKYTAELNAARARTTASANTMGATATKMGGVTQAAMLAGGAAVGFFAVSSVKAALEFDKSFTRIAAISNASAKDVERWKGDVLDLAGETARAPRELADALFFLSSAGLDTGQVMETLDLSAKAAASGLGSTVDVAKITANALNAYADAGLTATQVTDTLVAAVREGSAEPEEFAAALGRILPIASKADIEFDQVTASLAALSNIGLDVNEGVTAMRGLMTALFAPTAKTQDALTKLGLSADDVRASLSGDGLIATLRMLEERADGNIDVMAALVPNVRALTGVFGLTGQEAAKVDDIFASVLDSTGSLSDAFATTAESDAFKFAQAMNELQVAGQDLATNALPLIAAVMGELTTEVERLLGPLQFVADLIDQLGGKADVGGLSVAGLAGHVKDYLALPFEAGLHLANAAIDQFTTSAEEAAAMVENQTDAQRNASFEAMGLAGAWREGGREAFDLAGRVQVVSEEFERTAKVTASFAGLSRKEIKELRADVIADFDAMAGGLTGLSRRWDLTSAAAVRATDIIAEKQRIMAEDLGKLDKLKIGDGLKQQLLELGPDMVRAFISGNKNQREEIRENLKAYDEAAKDTTDETKQIAKIGGEGVGTALMTGTVSGIVEHSGLVAAAARRAVTDAIAAARDAAEADSPSKKMRRLGLDLIQGLVEGLESEDEHAVRAAERVIQQMTRAVENEIRVLTRAMEKEISDLESRLSRVQGKASDLRGSVMGGFGSFLDISGGFTSEVPDPENPGQFLSAPPTGASIQEFFASQVAGAEQFAAILKALQTQGISSALLGQIAGAGPEAIPFAQQLLQMGPEGIAGISGAFQTISDLATSTAGGLSESYFGSKIDELRGELRGMRGDLREETRLFEMMLRLLERPQRLELAFRSNGDRALRQLILEVIQEVGLSRASV